MPSRSLLLSLAVALVAAAPAAAAQPTGRAPTNAELFAGKTADPYHLALRAYVFGYPLVDAAQARLASTDPAHPFVKRAPFDGGAAINNLGWARVLANPSFKGTTPNNTTLYSQTWIDTRSGPYVLLTPDFGDRYYTFQPAQADTSTRVSLGARVNGSKLRPLFIYGPGYHGTVPAGMTGVRSKFRYLFLLGRILANPDRPGDTAAVRELQDQVHLVSYRSYRAGARRGRNPVSRQAPIDRPGDPRRLAFLAELSRVLRQVPPDAAARPLVRSLRRIGVRPGHFDVGALSAAERRAVRRGLAAGRRAVAAAAQRYGTTVNGWSSSFDGPRFGRDFLRRAVIQRVLPFLNVPQESLYPKATTDATGAPLDGAKAYRLHFAPGQKPPVRFFWSLIAYDRAGHMTENPIKRYSLGNLTPGLVDNPDGSMDLIVSHDRPDGPLAANWLPAPAGRFFLVLRLYAASDAVFDGRWKPPVIEPLG